MFLTFAYVLLTLLISAWNAHVVGMYWTERRELPTSTQVLLWSGVVMAVCGFTIGYLIIVTMVMYDIHAFEFLAMAIFKVEFTPSNVELLVQSVFDMAYLGIIVPVLGSGLIITVNSWIVAAKRRDLVGYGVAGYNTGAQIHNFVSAARHIPRATRNLSGAFRVKLGKGGAQALAWFCLLFLPIVLSLGGAIATTAIIMKASDARYELDSVAAR